MRVVFRLGVVMAMMTSWSDAQSLDRMELRVVDDASGQPVANAAIELPDAAPTLTSGAHGAAAAPLPPGDHWTLRVSAEGFTPTVVTITRTTPMPVTVRLQARAVWLSERVVVTAGRTSEPLADVPRAVSVVTSEDLERRLPSTTPDALMESAGVLVQKTNLGAGAPYVRGLVGNQILVLVDGVRLNNATSRFGPNQYLGTIDPDALASIEVVRGPGSVLYGSDAIGGVVHLMTRQPEFSAGGWQRSIDGRASLSAGAVEQGGRLGGALAGPRVAVRGGLSAHHFADLRAGGNRGTLTPTGYAEVAADAGVAVRLAPAHLLTATIQTHQQNDVPRWDQVAQRGFARYAFDPQTRQLVALRYAAQALGWADTASATLSVQRTEERRRIQRGASTIDTTETDRVRTVGLALDASKRVGRQWQLQAGAEFYADQVASARVDLDTRTGVGLNRRGLYPDGASASSAAMFGRGVWRYGRVRAEAGARYSAFSVSASDAAFQHLELQPSAWVGQGGASLRLTGETLLFGSLAQSFRAPNIDDLSTLGRFDSGIEVPSAHLSPERGLTSEAGLRVRRRSATATVVAFRTTLNDLIDRVRATYEGAATFDGQAVFQKSNVGEARITGWETEFEWLPRRDVVVTAHATMTTGQALTRNEPMRRIPPPNGGLSARWTPRAAMWAGVSTRWARRQDRLSSGDLADHRISPTGTPAWLTVDAFGALPLGRSTSLVVGVRNLFDGLYRVHGSGIDAPGRTVWVALRTSHGRPGPRQPRGP